MNYIHNKDPPIVHRDLKPQNILLDTFKQVKIADLGLSRKMGNSANTMRLEDTELFAGTIRYMAPELFDEEPSCSRATDVWSFACILHQLFTNELPWQNLELAGVQRRLVLKQPFPVAEGLPEDVSALVVKCTDLDPRARPKFNYIIGALEVMSGVPQSLPL
jgi:serine/threonine-protein kinase CTR1